MSKQQNCGEKQSDPRMGGWDGGVGRRKGGAALLPSADFRV